MKKCNVIDVKENNEKICDTYNWLSKSAPKPNDLENGKISWNFAKFVVNGAGKCMSYHLPDKDPNDILPELKKIMGAWNFTPWQANNKNMIQNGYRK